MIRCLASSCASRDVSAAIRRFQLGLAQHAAQLPGAGLLVHHGVHLVQGEPRFFSTMMRVEVIHAGKTPLAGLYQEGQ